MIHILIKPETLMEYLRFQFRGTAPSISCDEIRYGAGIIECIHAEANSCTAIPSDRVLRIFWDGGYSQAVAKVKAEFMDRIKTTTGIPEDPDIPLTNPAAMYR